jgi:hypothetical protein
MQCSIHNTTFHAFCPDCMAQSTTKFGAGPNDSYYPPGDKKDMVNSPAHYTQGNIECIEAIAEVVKDLDGMEAMCTGNAIKYLWRWKHKNGAEDLKKAVWYIQRMIDELDSK